MDLIKGKMGTILLLVCLMIAAAVAWYCLIGMREQEKTFEGTFVQMDMAGGDLAV